MKNDKTLLHRRSMRLPHYDYSADGAYYVTICAQDRKYLFGEITNSEMMLNDAGKIIEKWWQKLPFKYEGIEIDEYRVMPNHIHGIIKIVGADPRVRPNNVPKAQNVGGGQTHGSAPTPVVGTFIQWFKTMTTNDYIRNVKSNGWPRFNKRLWQRNYYEHVVRDDMDLSKIREYIRYNPNNWEQDEENLNFIRNSKSMICFR